jgi:protein-tyrosine phosphatase
LGVARPVVMQDYLLTNELFQMPKTTRGLASPEVLDVLWHVQEDFLDAALQVVEADFGGVQPYLEQALGLNPKKQERLVALYLQA